MPIYEYQCSECKSGFELLVRNGEQPSCPDCESTKIDKQLSVAAAPRGSGGTLPVMGSPAPNLGGG